MSILLPIGMLLAGVALECILAGVLSPKAKGWLAFLAGLAALAGVVAVWPSILAGRALDVTFGSWDGPVQLAYHLDSLSFLFALMGAGIGSAVLLYSIGYMAEEKGTTRFYALMLIFIAGLIHLVYTADWFLIYLSWEIVGLCSFLLVGFWYHLPESAYGARKVLTMTHLAGYGLLTAVVLLYVRTGSTLWTSPAARDGFTTGIFMLMLVAAVAKSVQFPLHTWIPDAMAAPTPVSALLHAACYVKAGVYLVARLHSIRPWPDLWGSTVAWLGAVTLLVGVLFALAQHDLKRLLAFHTVSQIGYMMLGLGIGTPLGIAAALFHCLNHGLFKGGLFLCAGAVQHACGTRDMDQMGALGRRMPRTMAVWLIVAGGIAGIPLLNGFASKWLLYNAALEANQPVLALIPWIGSILTVFSFLKATSGVFLGSEGPASERAREAPWTMVGGAGVLAAGCVLLGVAPQLAITYLINPLLPAVGSTPLTGITWFGVAAGEGVWFATGGMLLGLVALAFGTLAYRLYLPARSLVAAGGPPTVFTGGEPLGAQGRLGASDFSRIVKDALGPFYQSFDADRLWLLLWHALGRVAASLAAPLRQAERFPALLLGILGAAACVTVGVFTPQANLSPAHGIPSLQPLGAGLALSLTALLLCCAAIPSLRRWIVPIALAGGMACGGVLAPDPLLRTTLLEGGSLVALVVLWQTNRTPAARHGYLAAVVFSAIGMVGGTLAASHGDTQLAAALLLPALAIKLGLIPFWFWLPLVAETTPALISGLVIAIVDVAAFAEVLALRGLPWLPLGIISATLGALLALAQRDLKRLLAFSTISDLGFLIVANAFGGRYGLQGAIFGATAHALAKALLFTCVAGPEAEGEALVNPRGLASRHALGSLGFLVGALAVVGVPPTLGYVAHWRIFSTAAGDPLLFAALAGAAMLMVAIYARAITLFWWGTASATTSERAYSRPVMGVAVVLLSLALLATGIWPRLLGGLR